MTYTEARARGWPIMVYIKDRNVYYKAFVSRAWAQGHDNGVMFSCGLKLVEDVKAEALDELLRKGQAVQVTFDEYNHSGCQSECVLRGGKTCRW